MVLDKSTQINGKANANDLQTNIHFDSVEGINAKPPVGTEGFKKISDLVDSDDGDLVSSIINESPYLYNQNGVLMSKSRFIKLNASEETFWLLSNHPVAYLLLNLIALRAQRTIKSPSGLNVGESFLGDYGAIGATRQQYRTALQVLVNLNYIKICETSRTRKKSTNGTTTKGTKVKLLSSVIWDINEEDSNQPINQRATNDQPTTNHDQERKKDKNDKKNHHHTSSFLKPQVDGLIDDDFFQKEKIKVHRTCYLSKEDLDECLSHRGSMEVICLIIDQILDWPGRKHEIKNWSKSIKDWQIKNTHAVKSVCNEKIAMECQRLYENANGWTARIFNDRLKDQKGLLFEGQGAATRPIFISYAVANFEEQVRKVILEKKMVPSSK